MPINLDALLISVIVNTVIISPVLWLAGRAVVGKDKAKLTDAIWIVVLGTVIGTLFGAFFVGWIATIILLILWLALVKHFFDCGWLKALGYKHIGSDNLRSNSCHTSFHWNSNLDYLALVLRPKTFPSFFKKNSDCKRVCYIFANDSS